MDRLQDLKAVVSGAEGGFSPSEGGRVERVCFLDPPSEVDQMTVELLDAFYVDAQQVHQIIHYIQNLTDALDEIHAENIRNVEEAKSAALRKEIAQRSAQVTVQLNFAKEALEKMGKNSAELKKDPEMIMENSAVVRIQDNFYYYLARRLNLAMMDYQKRQSINQEKYKAQTKRQIMIKFTKADGSSIDNDTAQQLTEQVLENQVSNAIFQQSKNILASITETRNDIYRIEQSMRDLHQMFNELAIMVNEQGQMMDVILSNLQSSSKYLERGRRELKRARKYQKSSRKKLYCLLGCGLFLFVLVAVIALGFLLPK